LPGAHHERHRWNSVAWKGCHSVGGQPDFEQLADGHPDILPTKEAKAALERLK
jgi:hypothetical protein